MRLLHLADRLDERRPRVLRAVGALAAAHPSIVAVGVPRELADMPCEIVRVEGLADIAPRALGPSLDALADRFAPDAVLLHAGVNADAIGWVAARRGIVVVTELRAYHPERAIGRANPERVRRDGAKALCPECFVSDPFFRSLAEAARARVASLRGAARVLVATEEERAELASLGVAAAIDVVNDLGDGSALLAVLEATRR